MKTEDSNKSQFFFPSEVTTNYGKLKIIHKVMHCAVNYPKVFSVVTTPLTA